MLNQLNSLKRIIFIAIGTELLSGDVLETNSHWLQNQLKAYNAEMVKIEILGDEMDAVISSLDHAIKDADYVIICGGLGPTDDDLTREAVSKATDRPLVFNPESWEDIKAFFQRRNRTAGKSNEKQALQPEGSDVLKNSIGTAPGFSLTVEQAKLMTFPGVPSEFFSMVYQHFLPELKTHQQPAHFKLWGIGESDLMDKLKSEGCIPDHLPWGTIARKEGLSLHFYREATEKESYQETVKKVRSFLKEYIYTEKPLNPLELLAQDALEQNYSLACAESCTGGMISEMFTRIPGSSSFFNGSIVAYQNEIKTSLLDVPVKVLENHGAVSPECVEAMAKGCAHTLKSEMALAVSGIAGPSGGTEQKPVGTVYIAAYYNGHVKSQHLKLSGNRQDIRERSTYALCLLAWNLRHGR